MQLRQLECFRTLMIHGTMTRTAELMSISQPAVSNLIAALEYENTILKLETEGGMTTESVDLSLEMAKLGGMKDLVPASEIISTQFKPVPTKP